MFRQVNGLHTHSHDQKINMIVSFMISAPTLDYESYYDYATCIYYRSVSKHWLVGNCVALIARFDCNVFLTYHLVLGIKQYIYIYLLVIPVYLLPLTTAYAVSSPIFHQLCQLLDYLSVVSACSTLTATGTTEAR